MSERREPHDSQRPRIVDWPGSMVLIVTAARNIRGELEVRIAKHVDGGVRQETVWFATPEEAAEFVKASVGEMIGRTPDPDSAPSRTTTPDSAPRPHRDSAPRPHRPAGQTDVNSPPPPASASPRPPTS